MADKLDSVYKNINDPDVKKKWIQILQDNPTSAIDAYHKALCSENETKGWCGLMNLFRILGALEQAKNEKQNHMLTRQLSSSSVQSEDFEETKTDLNEEHDRDLNNINEALIKLKDKIGNMSSKNKQSSSEAPTKESQIRQPEMGDTNKQIEEHNQQIQQLNNEHKQNIEQIKREHETKLNEEEATKEQKQQEIEKLSKEIDVFKKNHEEEVKKLQETISQLEQSNQQNNATQEEIEKLKKNIEQLNTSNNEELEKLQNKYKIKLEQEKSKMKEEVELWKNKSEESEEIEYIEGGNNAELPVSNEMKEATASELKSVNINIGNNANANKANEIVVNTENIEINVETCGDDKFEMNEKIGKNLFSLYEKAKELLHSDMLILVGCVHFYKSELLETTPSIQKLLVGLEKELFIQLTKEEYSSLDNQISGINQDLKKVFDKICERDNKYKNKDSHQSIMVYALLWLFHFNTTISIKSSESTYQQILSNKTLFNSDDAFISSENCTSIQRICEKIKNSIDQLEKIKKEMIDDTRKKQEFVNLKKKYIKIVQDNKSVLALLKRRDDWNNANSKGSGIKHSRFKLYIPDNTNSINKPITLKYNDTPLEINQKEQEDKDGISVLDKMMTHHYTFYGFDSIFNSKVSNKDIAIKLKENFIKEDSRPLCFIGYGQSGSGKTSALIQLDTPKMKQDGILIELLHKINPEQVTVSMIEIYQDEAAQESDKSCIGIGTKDNAKKEQIIQCHPDGVKSRKKINYPSMKNEPNTSMRYVTIGEVLDKQFDDKTKGTIRNPSRENDEKTETVFNIGKYSSEQCTGEDANQTGWFYTHDGGSGEECLDKNFGLKKYILMGFECREIAPTSNNKQSSRSHVVVSLKLDKGEWGEGNSRYIYVCDLAGVENVFDCSPGSTDMIRMKAKTKANKNYSNNVGNGNIENWDSLKEKRTGNIVKYIHKDIHIAISTPTNPNCWPDGNANKSGDIGEIAENFSKELMQIYYYDIKGKNIMIGKEEQHGGGDDVNANSVFEYFKNKLEKLPLKKENGEIIGIDSIKNNIQKFWKLANDRPFNLFLKGMDSRGRVATTEITNDMVENINWDKWKDIRYSEKAHETINFVKTVFNKLQAPDCNSSYESGFKKACDIRVKEGYIINSTLAQLTKDVKRISKYAIKERFESNYPCLYADIYDEYTYYSKSSNPLMDWYDIDDLSEDNFGSILSAMCLLNDKNISKWTIPEKLNFLKQFRFNYCTVLNETFIMKTGENPVVTSSGKKIYVNNPPLPPFINVGILENSYKEFIFYENDPRDYKDVKDSNKYKAFLNLHNNFFNLVIKMFKHPQYEEEAVKVMQRISSPNSKLIFFENDDDMLKNFKNETNVDYLKVNSESLINLIKNNNNATFIGTIQTTEEVNRVSQKIILSEAVNQEKQLSSIDPKNLNVDILKKTFVSCFLRQDGEMSDNNTKYSNNGTTIQRNFDGSKKRELSAILYECLYEINKLYQDKRLLKPCQTMKERDIDGMLNAIETVFPIMTRFIDPLKLQAVWEKISSLERGKSVISKKNLGMYSEKDKQSYPYERDLTINGSKGLWEKKIYTKEQFEKAFINNKIKKSDTPLLDFNNVLTSILKEEPSIPYITQDTWEEKNKKENNEKRYYPSLKMFYKAIKFKRRIRKQTIMPYLSTNKFYNAVYGAYIGKTFEEPNKWDGKNPKDAKFTSFNPVKPSALKKYISTSTMLMDNGVKDSYPPSSNMKGGNNNNNNNKVTSDKIVKTINEIGESIGNLGGMNQQQPSQNEISNEDLERLKQAIGELQNHIIDNMKEINKGITEVDIRAKEALDQIKEKKNEMQFNDLKMK